MRVLFVTEEQGFSGAAQHPVLRFFYRCYFDILQFQIQRMIAKFSSSSKLAVLTNRAFVSKCDQRLSVTFYFFEVLQERIDYVKLRTQAWNDVRHLKTALSQYPELTHAEVFLPEVTQTQVALYLLFNTYKFEELLEQLIHNFKPDCIVTLSRASLPEYLAHRLANRYGISTQQPFLFRIGWLNRLLNDFLRRREKRQWHLTLRKIASHAVRKNTDYRTGEIFFVAQHPTHHVKTLAPLARKIEEKHHIPTFFFADLPKLRDCILSFTHELPSHWSTVVEHLAPRAFENDYLNFQKIFTRLFRRIKKKRQLCDYPWDVSSNFLFRTFRYDFPLAAILIPTIERLMRERIPRGVVVPSDRRVNETLFPIIARKLGIPSLLATSITNMSLETANNYDICDSVAVAGDYIKELLIKIGHAPKNVHIVGDLRFDDLRDRIQHFKQDRLRKKYNVPQYKKIVLLLSSDIGPLWTENKKKRFFQAVFHATRLHPRAFLIVKSHPNESIALLKRHMLLWGMRDVALSFNDHLHDLLLASHLTTMIYSMAGLESLLLGRPVINVMFEGENVEHYLPYVTGKGAIGVYTEDELQTWVQKFLDDDTVYRHWVQQGKDFVHRFIREPDGKVSDRIVKIFHDLQSKSS